MDAKDKIITGKVRLQRDNPFFSYLVMNLKVIEDNKVTKTCAVDNKGNLYYNPEFIDKLSNEEVKTLLCHEVLHIALQHLIRVESKDKELWNISADIIINNMLVNNNFTFSSGLSCGLIPSYNRFDFKGIRINDIDKKCAEEVYNIIYSQSKKDKENDGNEKGDNSNGNYTGFDEHLTDNSNLTEEEVNQIQKEWKEKLVEASTFAQLHGNLPAGMDRYITKLLENKLNWKELLYKYITQDLPSRYTYSLPSKKSYSAGVYLPKLLNEKIDITIALDTSGSISKHQLTEFLSEIAGITQCFQNIKLNVLAMDTEINNHFVVNNNDIDSLLNENLKGGGGTDFKEVYNYVSNEIPNTKLLLFFSDGYANYPDNEDYKTLWIITKDGINEKEIPFGEIIRMD